jgi:hypothetical protein
VLQPPYQWLREETVAADTHLFSAQHVVFGVMILRMTDTGRRVQPRSLCVLGLDMHQSTAHVSLLITDSDLMDIVRRSLTRWLPPVSAVLTDGRTL